MRLGDSFNRFAKATARACGHPYTFAAAVLLVVLWALTGPLFDYSDTWQLVINTATTVLTFLVVFLIQNTQNRDAADRKSTRLNSSHQIISYAVFCLRSRVGIAHRIAQ